MAFAVTEFFAQLVSILDKWVIVISLVTVTYLTWNFRKFYRKYIVGSYILVILLFVFWAIRSVFYESAFTETFWFLGLSFIIDTAVVVFTSSIIYHYQKWGDVKYVRKLFGLQRVDETGEVIQYEGPDVESIEPGRYYLILEKGQSYEWKLFEALSEDLPALCFTRKQPHKIDMDHSKRDIMFYWLSESDIGNVERHNVKKIEPFRRGEMAETIQEFTENNQNPVILIDGLEYLIYKNSPEAILEFIQNLHDQLANRFDTTLLYSVDRDGISDETFSILKEEVQEVRWMDEDGTCKREVF